MLLKDGRDANLYSYYFPEAVPRHTMTLGQMTGEQSSAAPLPVPVLTILLLSAPYEAAWVDAAGLATQPPQGRGPRLLARGAGAPWQAKLCAPWPQQGRRVAGAQLTPSPLPSLAPNATQPSS
jgi:hypothetical protein